MESILRFEDLPAEALFNFFCSLDPSLVASYSTVCKKWDRLYRDNELWRRYCLEKWDKNPNESDCAKNWLIPVREGAGSKEKRIDWKRCYIIRSYFTKGVESAPKPEKQPLGFLKRKKSKKTQSNSMELFAKGWPTVEDLAKFIPQICAGLLKADKILQEKDTDHDDYPDFRDLLSFFGEMKLLMVRQINISRVKYLGINGQMFAFIPRIGFKLDEVLPRLAKYAVEYVQLAHEKDIPPHNIAKFLETLTGVVTNRIHMSLYIELSIEINTQATQHLVRFISAIISAMHKALPDGQKSWMEDESVDESPTTDLERCLDDISDGLLNYPDIEQRAMPIFYAAIDQALGTIDTKEKDITKLAVISAVLDHIPDDLTHVMTSTILPIWTSPQDPLCLVPALYFVSKIVSLGDDRIQKEYVHDIIPPLLIMAQTKIEKAKLQVASFVNSFCKYLNDPDVLAPYLLKLLDAMYGYLKSDNFSVREKALMAISDLTIKCHTSFLQHKDRTLNEIKKVLLDSNSPRDRKEATKCLLSIGTGINKLRSSIAPEVEVIYDQILEDYKNNQDLDTLLGMTEFTVAVLGPKFSKHLPLVLPLVLQNAQLVVTAQKDPDNSDDHMDVEDLEKAYSRKEAALACLGAIVALLGRQIVMPHHTEIGLALTNTLHTDKRLDDIMELALHVYETYVRMLFVPEDPVWASSVQMSHYWENSSRILVTRVRETEAIFLRTKCVFFLTKLFKHFCALATPEQPFLTLQMMTHLRTEVFEVLCNTCYEMEEVILDDGNPHLGAFRDEAICNARIDKEMFWSFAEPIIAHSIELLEDPNQDDSWLDYALIGTVFGKFETEFFDEKRGARFKPSEKTILEAVTSSAPYLYIHCRTQDL